MKIDQVRYFLEAAKTQHIGNAATALAVSPSAISHSISQLQEELGIQLFEKRGKNIILTLEGKRLAETITPLVQQFENIKNIFTSENASPSGLIKISATHGLAGKILAPKICSLQKKYENLKFEIFSLRSSQVVDSVLSGEMDIGICYSPLHHPKISKIPLKKEPLRFAVRKNHPSLKLTKGEAVKKLSEIPFIAPKSFQGIESCEDHPSVKKFGIKTNGVLAFDSYDVACEVLKNSNSWSVVPDFFVKHYGLDYIDLKDDSLETTITAIHPKGRPLPSYLHEWLTTIDFES